MKTANEFKELRDKKYDDWINFDKKVKGQWQLLETIIDRGFNSLGHSQKYIDITNVGELYKENEKKLISEPNCFYITKDKNGTRLYFDAKDYEEYINGYKKLSLKKDSEAQVKEDIKIEINKNNTDDNFKLIFSTFDGKAHHEKEYNSFEELKKDVEITPEFFKIFE